MLSQNMRGERIFRMAFYLPVILGFNTAVLLAWRLMLNTGTGIINQMIRAAIQAFPPLGYAEPRHIFAQELATAFFLGLSNGKFTLLTKVWEAGFPAANRVPLWVQSPLWSKMSVVLLMIWGCGAMMLIFLAGLKNIPQELHEAAEVDGANSWKRFWKISFPLAYPLHLLQPDRRPDQFPANLRADLCPLPRQPAAHSIGHVDGLLPLAGQFPPL